MSEPILSFEALRVAFGSTEVVHGLSFGVNPGEVVALVGESGSGKSVSAMSVLRLLPEPPANYPGGRILWQGEDVLRMDAKRLRRLRGGEVGMVFQEPMTALNPTMTAGAQVAEALEIHTALDAPARRVRTIELFRAVGIPQPEARVDSYPHEMSGGQRQRVCIAMALACEPRLLIADEPTTALDVTIQAQILDLLKELQRSRGLSVLFITHDLGLVRELADRVVVMRNGEAVEQGAVAGVFADPKHPYTRGLLTCKPVLGRRVARLTTVADAMAGG
ncbi:MAG: ABC transporter ATP-binding protein [Planctomycetes bacterium]|nr:ABC transporter ATP-binding protein [Planctomycetota bacterium]